jgi:hypothetical protein
MIGRQKISEEIFWDANLDVAGKLFSDGRSIGQSIPGDQSWSGLWQIQ